MWQILDKSERLAQDLIQIGGDNIQNLLAAIIIRDFDPELQTEWTNQLGKEELLSLDKLNEFITPLAHNLPKKKYVNNHGQHDKKKHNNSSAATSFSHAAAGSDRKSSKKPANKKNKNCQMCNEAAHPLFKCKKILEFSIQQNGIFLLIIKGVSIVSISLTK